MRGARREPTRRPARPRREMFVTFRLYCRSAAAYVVVQLAVRSARAGLSDEESGGGSPQAAGGAQHGDVPDIGALSQDCERCQDDSDLEKHLADVDTKGLLAAHPAFLFEFLSLALNLFGFFFVLGDVGGVLLNSGLTGGNCREHIARDIRFIPPDRLGLIIGPLVGSLLLRKQFLG